jgi:RNA polymerase sigma-70 factor (ECF subfamily)
VSSSDSVQPEPSDEQLLAEHLAGQEGRFEQLVERHSRELFQFLARFSGNQAAADDLVQETFLQVHISAATFDTSRRFRPWLFAIAANKARDRMRWRARRPELPLDAAVDGDQDGGRRFADVMADDAVDPSEPLEAKEQQQLVRKLVERMPEHLREVLILAYFHRFPYKQIAEVLEIPLGTVKSRLHAAVGQFGLAWRETVGE